MKPVKLPFDILIFVDMKVHNVKYPFSLILLTDKN